ncbi:hypothetical protein DPMN_088552 [Dreissena polymorpha]|uniref:Uncharacterized protein n=1 Tax=Dreissena polymorpha TaxID=45954 RepID=A0A9D4QX74_DREPO|nr:hypothetical protein DPMN_088552 [Dreissena polymorpha]
MCQDEMEQVMELSERLLPTLDMNDTATLRQSLKNTEQKLANIMASSQRQQTEMEKRAQDWNEYQVFKKCALVL